MPQASSPVIHPPIGTLIDGDSLELVEVLSAGQGSVVYRAVDTRRTPRLRSYAVKCLITSGHRSARQRQAHIREITLHQLASAHPGVVTLYRVIEQYSHTYIITDYADSHDLFAQIVHDCRYLGRDDLTKVIFLQLLDAVEYCHSLCIYHQNLTLQSIVCHDDGLRVSITDFSHATTDKLSNKFCTDSDYHISPEWQGGAFAPGGRYSPMFNDIWSLGIILLNITTGRSPWNSATLDDPNFQAYLRDPYGFLPTVVPISSEFNEVLVRMLEVDWRERMKLRDIRHSIEELTTFYSDGVVFEGSVARCPWEVDMGISNTKASNSARGFSRSTTEELAHGEPGPKCSSCGATWAYNLSSVPLISSSSNNDFGMNTFGGSDRLYEASKVTFAVQQGMKQSNSRSIRDTDTPRLPIRPTNGRFSSLSDKDSDTNPDMMHTAIEYDPYSLLFFLSPPNPSTKQLSGSSQRPPHVFPGRQKLSDLKPQVPSPSPATTPSGANPFSRDRIWLKPRQKQGGQWSETMGPAEPEHHFSTYRRPRTPSKRDPIVAASPSLGRGPLIVDHHIGQHLRLQRPLSSSTSSSRRSDVSITTIASTVTSIESQFVPTMDLSP